MASIFSGHVSVGTDNAEKAEAEARDMMSKAFELILATLDRTTDDAFTARDAAEAFLNSVQNGSMQMPATPAKTTPVAMLGAGDNSATSAPSLEEELGAELLTIAATEGDARKLLSLARTVTNGGPALQGAIVLIAEDIRNGRDQIVNDGRGFRLKSLVDAKHLAEVNATLVYDLTEVVCGYVTSGETPQSAVAEAKKEFAKKTAPAVNQDDKYLGILESVSTIKANLPGTTFEQHLRVVLDECRKAGVVFADELKRKSGVEYTTGTPIVTYVDTVIKALRPAVPNSKELDAIGGKIGESRGGDNDADFGRRLIVKIDGMIVSVNALDKDVKRAAAIHKANGSAPTVPNGTTPVGILELIIKAASDNASGVIKVAGGMKKVTLP